MLKVTAIALVVLLSACSNLNGGRSNTSSNSNSNSNGMSPATMSDAGGPN
jgi:hypothetical protein